MENKYVKKLAKWMEKAASATTRKEGLKAAKKYEKWNKKLSDHEAEH